MFSLSALPSARTSACNCIIWTDNFCLTSSYSSQFLYSSNYQVISCRWHGNHSPPKREGAIVKIVQIVVHIYQSAKRVKQYSRSAGVGGGGGILIIKWKEGLVDLTFSINLSPSVWCPQISKGFVPWLDGFWHFNKVSILFYTCPDMENTHVQILEIYKDNTTRKDAAPVKLSSLSLSIFCILVKLVCIIAPSLCSKRFRLVFD